MRETVISEVEEDVKSRMSRSSRDSAGSANRSTITSSKGMPARSAMPKPHPVDPAPAAWSKRPSSRLGGSRENLREANQQNGLRRGMHDMDAPSAASRSDVTERTSTSATESTISTTFDTRNDQILLYFDQPADSTTTADSSVDFSDDYMEDSDGEDLIVNERRTSRTKSQSQRDSASGWARGQRTSSAASRRESGHNSQYLKDSILPSPLHIPAKGYRLQDVPEDEVQSEYDEDIDADDIESELDGFPRPPMPPPTWPLPPRPEKPPTKPANPPAPTGFLHPSTAAQQGQRHENKPRHLKNKRSMVRLSAVGRSHTAMPWWGDED
ncbi:hypothetical protein ONZ43_g2098 [Nemania bipapillata]|uniref:Uncharacterized protein n=1 Tax=Nemania bipapillata TaxID=110536 RepID=A0ACC2J222_9PEZI|nr:hypothetical protein ONZ43_g2098 [Nemania bipapillata]